jgi:hypothetical protein
MCRLSIDATISHIIMSYIAQQGHMRTPLARCSVVTVASFSVSHAIHTHTVQPRSLCQCPYAVACDRVEEHSPLRPSRTLASLVARITHQTRARLNNNHPARFVLHPTPRLPAFSSLQLRHTMNDARPLGSACPRLHARTHSRTHTHTRTLTHTRTHMRARTRAHTHTGAVEQAHTPLGDDNTISRILDARGRLS